MRVVKQRLLEMLPDVHAFLDVDDLKEGKGAGAATGFLPAPLATRRSRGACSNPILTEYIDVSVSTLALCTAGYFDSKLLSTTVARSTSNADSMTKCATGQVRIACVRFFVPW